MGENNRKASQGSETPNGRLDWRTYRFPASSEHFSVCVSLSLNLPTLLGSQSLLVMTWPWFIPLGFDETVWGKPWHIVGVQCMLAPFPSTRKGQLWRVEWSIHGHATKKWPSQDSLESHCLAPYPNFNPQCHHFLMSKMQLLTIVLPSFQFLCTSRPIRLSQASLPWSLSAMEPGSSFLSVD